MKGNKFTWTLDHYDAFTFLIVGGLGFLTSVSFIFLNLYFKESRRFPSILLTLISLGEMFISLHWVLTGLNSRFLFENRKISSKGTFCQINAIVACLGTMIQYSFHLSFLLTLIKMFQNTLTKTKNKNFYVIVPTLIALLGFGLYLFLEGLGKNFFGECTIKDSSLANVVMSWLFLALFLFFAIWALLVLNHFKKSTRRYLLIKNSEEFYMFYKKYTISMMIFYTVSSINHLLSHLFQLDLYQRSYVCESGCMRKYFLLRLSNNIMLYFPVLSFALRISDPYLTNIIQTYKNQRKTSVQKHLMNESFSMFLNETSTYLFNKSSFTVDKKDNMFNQTLYRIKMRCTETILMCLEAYYLVILQSASRSLRDMEQVFIRDMEYDIDQLIQIKKDFIREQEMRKTQSFSQVDSDNSIDSFEEIRDNSQTNLNVNLKCIPEICHGKINIYFVRDFAKILLQAGYVIEALYKSFKKNLNRQNINKTGTKAGNKGGNGGASGEFFFITYDKKFIIKTITREEEQIFSQVIGQYTRHVTADSSSLLNRIIGYFVFDFDILNEKIRIIVIENLFQIDKKYIKRKYDLKGSTYKRKTIRRKNIDQIRPIIDSLQKFKARETLKDIDFNRIEEKIVLLPHDKRKMLQILERDVNFLRSLGIIDYSLIVGVVDMNEVFGESNDYEARKVREELDFLVKHSNFFSHVSNDVGYIVGIIDLFQKYTFSKWLEKHFKRMIHFSFKLDTSSQPATIYAERFMDYMKTIITD